MSQPCSAVELVLFDARDLNNPEIRHDLETVVSLGVLSGAVLNDAHVANVVTQAGFAEEFGFWFGGDGTWPFERALAFANIEPGRTLFVSSDPAACETATSLGIRPHDDRATDIAALLP
jgi:hypothetical protein